MVVAVADQQPDYGEFGQRLAAQLAHVRHVLVAQAAMGWMVRGDLTRARRELAKLPAEALREVAVASAALSTLADELTTSPTEDT